MSARFSYNLLKLLTQKRSDGFSLVLVTAAGTIALVVGAAMMVKGMNDRNQVISQDAKNSSNAAMETGVTRVQRMMNDNKFLLTLSLDPEAGTNQWGTMSGSTFTPTSAATTEINRIATAKACSNSDATSVAASMTNSVADLYKVTLNDDGTNTNQAIDPSDPSKGRFRIRSYKYNPTARVATLDLIGTSPKSAGGSRSRVEVDIPVNTTPPVASTDVVPGLWVKKGGVNDGTTYETSSTTLQNNGARFAANVAFSDCDNTLSNSYISAVQTNRVLSPGTVAQKTALLFPSLPYRPTGTAQTISSAISLNGNGLTPVSVPELQSGTMTNIPVYHYIVRSSATSSLVTTSPPSGSRIYVYNTISGTNINATTNAITGTLTLPRTTDVASSDGKYRYLVQRLEFNGNNTLTLNTATNNGIVFYVGGNIGGSGNPTITVNCASGEGAPSCSEQFQIFAYNLNTSGAANTTPGQICLKGNANISGYIVAPDYDLGKTGNGTFIGSLFGRSWGKIQNCGSANGATAVQQTATWSQIPSIQATFLPTMGAVNGYRGKAAD